MSYPLNTPQLRALIDAGAIKRIDVIATPEGCTIRVNGKQDLHAQRGQVRVFSRAETCFRYLAELGVDQVNLNLKGLIK